MKKQIIWLLALIVCGNMVAQESLNLKEVIALTIANNPQVKKAEASRIATYATVEKARANYYPQLAANAGYTRIDPVGFVEFPSANGLVQTTFIPNDNYNFNLGLQFTVYDFGRTDAGVRLAKNGLLIADNSLILTKQELALATIQTFYQIHFLQEAIKVQNRQIDALNIALEQTKKLQDNGEATNYEILSTEVKLSRANNTKDDLQTSLKNALTILKQLTGNDAIEASDLADDWLSIENPNTLLQDIDITNTPEFKLSLLQSEDATLQEMLARRSFNPVLSANVQGGYKNAIQPTINELTLNYLASVQLTIPLFNGFKNKAALKEAEALNDASEFNLDDTSDQLEAQVKLITENLNNNYQKIARSNLQVTQAEKAVELARLKYKNGVITNLDLLDAEIELSEAEINKLNIVFNYTINTYQLKKAKGINLY